MSAEEIINYLLRNPNVSQADKATLMTSIQGLNPKIDDNADLELIIHPTGIKERITSMEMYSHLNTLGNKAETKNRGSDGVDSLIRKRIPDPCNSYPLIHTDFGSGYTFPLDTKFKGGIETDGVYYHRIDNQARLNVTDMISIVGWLKSPAHDGTNNEILAKGNVHTTVPYEIRQRNNGTIEFSIRDSTLTRYAIAYTHTPDSWFHFAMTWKGGGDNRLRAYIDKVQQGSDVTTGATLETNTQNLGIFAEADGGRDSIAGTTLAHLSLLHHEVDQTWINNHYDGILDTKTAPEITYLPFVGDTIPRPDATFGLCAT